MAKYVGGLAVVLGLIVSVIAGSVSAADSITAEAIYDATSVRGGLAVHLGCGDGRLTAAQRLTPFFPRSGHPTRIAARACYTNPHIALHSLRAQR